MFTLHAYLKQANRPLGMFSNQVGTSQCIWWNPPLIWIGEMYLPKLWRYKSPHFFHMFRRSCIETNRVVPSIWQQTRIRSWFSLNGFITYYTVQLTATVIFTPSLLSFLKNFQSSELSKILKLVMTCFFRFGWNSSRAE